MRLTPTEIVAMKQLASIVGRSPRATKRFVNIYRLLKAALPPKELRAFETDEFRAAMLLLAMVHSTAQAGKQIEEAAFEGTIETLPVDFRTEWAPSVVNFDRWRDRIRQFSFET